MHNHSEQTVIIVIVFIGTSATIEVLNLLEQRTSIFHYVD